MRNLLSRSCVLRYLKYSSSERMVSVILFVLSGPVAGNLRQSIALRKLPGLSEPLHHGSYRSRRGLLASQCFLFPGSQVHLPETFADEQRLFFLPALNDGLTETTRSITIPGGDDVVVMDFDNHDRMNDTLNESNLLKLADLKFICENTGLSLAYTYIN